jgi:hypothetical protein
MTLKRKICLRYIPVLNNVYAGKRAIFFSHPDGKSHDLKLIFLLFQTTALPVAIYWTINLKFTGADPAPSPKK